jgi:uncharacterized membrane protein
MWTCSEMKKTGWNRLSGTFGTAVLLTLIFSLISGVLPFFQTAINVFRLVLQQKVLSTGYSGIEDINNNAMTYNTQLLGTSGLSILISILTLAATFLLINPISVGYTRWFLANRNEEVKPSISILFSFFKSGKYGQTVAGMAWYTLWMMIWAYVASMCMIPFIIMLSIILFMVIFAFASSAVGSEASINSGKSLDYGDVSRNFMDIAPILLIIMLILFVLGLAGYLVIILNRKYAYMFTPFILAEKSNIGSANALNLSKNMTRGIKGKLFMLDLSFIGWCLLSVLTFGLLYYGIAPYMFATYTEVYAKRKEDLAIIL